MCGLVYVYWDYDDFEYYCHQDRSKRPRSGGVGCGEEWPAGRGIRKMLAVEWKRWAESRKVSFYGVCDKFEMKK
jgi:hypothetical protein